MKIKRCGFYGIFEIEILEKNLNHNDDPTWNNFYVDLPVGVMDEVKKYNPIEK